MVIESLEYTEEIAYRIIEQKNRIYFFFAEHNMNEN